MSKQDDHILEEGTVLDGKYVIQNKLGEGSMGAVYTARQEPIRRRVAIKVLHPRFVSNEEIRSRFLGEARAASQLSHPNTITIFDFGYAGEDLHYIVMEYVEGDTFEHVIDREGPLSLGRTAPIIVQIAQSLGEAHRKNIIHRDLKPANVLLQNVGSDNERVKVLDFGIAKLTNRNQALTEMGAVFGTPGYIAPEQAKGAEVGTEVDHTCDFYALTCCLFEALMGRVPYRGNSPVEIMMKHQTEPIPRLDAEFPDSLDAFLRKGMAKEPSERPQSADDYIAAFLGSFVEEFRGDSPGSARPSSGSGSYQSYQSSATSAGRPSSQLGPSTPDDPPAVPAGDEEERRSSDPFEALEEVEVSAPHESDGFDVVEDDALHDDSRVPIEADTQTYQDDAGASASAQQQQRSRRGSGAAEPASSAERSRRESGERSRRESKEHEREEGRRQRTASNEHREREASPSRSREQTGEPRPRTDSAEVRETRDSPPKAPESTGAHSVEDSAEAPDASNASPEEADRDETSVESNARSDDTNRSTSNRPSESEAEPSPPESDPAPDRADAGPSSSQEEHERTSEATTSEPSPDASESTTSPETAAGAGSASDGDSSRLSWLSIALSGSALVVAIVVGVLSLDSSTTSTNSDDGSTSEAATAGDEAAESDESSGAASEATDGETEMLSVESEPEEAQISLDGRSVGVTPSKVQIPVDRPFTLVLDKRGYEPERYEGIEASDYPGRKLFASLEQKTVRLKVQSPVPKAKLTIDGDSFGSLPKQKMRTFQIEWPTDTLSVVLDPPGYESYIKRFPVAAIRPEMRVTPSTSELVETSSDPSPDNAESDAPDEMEGASAQGASTASPDAGSASPDEGG